MATLSCRMCDDMPGRKTYVPSANTLANGLHEYLTRYQEKLINDKTSGQIAALAALISCLAEFIEAWPKPSLDN